MEKLTILAILLLVTLTAPTTWARMDSKKMNEIEVVEEIMQNKKVNSMAAVMALKKLQGCVEVGGNCVFIDCCPVSANGNPVICSRGPYNAVCVELYPGPSPWYKLFA
ncbi:unnamed protein product [Amaranthus hypochondriacus]